MFLGAYKYDYMQKKPHGNSYLYFELLCLILVSTFRYMVGADTLMYMLEFENDNALYELQHYNLLTSECGFLWYIILYICQELGSFYWLQFLHSLFVNIAIFYFFKKHSKYYFSCIFLYGILLFTYFNFEIMRASLGIGVWVLLGYDYLVEKKYVKYVVVAIIGSLFHIEMLFVFLLPLLYFLRNINISVKSLVILLLVSIIAEILFTVTADIFMLFSYSEYSTHKITMYADAINDNMTFAGFVMYFIRFSPYFIALYLCKNCSDFDSRNERMLVIVMIFISFVGIKYAVLVGRLADILYPVYILHLVKGGYLKRTSNVILKYIASLFIFLSVYINYSNGMTGYENWRRYVPYSNILDKEGANERASMLNNYKLDRK